MFDSFLACNSENGFVSLFKEMTKKQDHRIYLIKGGPGTGKSSFMKAVALAAKNRGESVEQIHCSSDPDSLDGVYIPGKKLIVLDATAPHCVDPVYPGAVEQILPFGECWDSNKLHPYSQDIIRLTDEIRCIFSRIYCLLRASGELRKFTGQIFKAAFLPEKALAGTAKFLRQQAVLPTGEHYTPEKRIICALSAGGIKEYDNIFRLCDRVLVIEDGYDVTDLWMQQADRLLHGCKRIHLVNPLCPDEIDHIILPEYRLGIVSHNMHTHPQIADKTVRTLRFKSAVNEKLTAEEKDRLSFARKSNRAIYDTITDLMASEKTLHDELEQYYIKAMDFSMLDKMKREFIANEL